MAAAGRTTERGTRRARAREASAEGENGRRGRTPADRASAAAATAATPWGAATVLEQVAVPQRAGDKRFAVFVQLLETRSGERLVRFAYATSGSARRGPVTMRARDVERLRAALERAPVLGAALGL